MTETLQTAAHNTALILDRADRARELLAGDGSPRSNGAGVLAIPAITSPGFGPRAS